jgi:hypothetical protein
MEPVHSRACDKCGETLGRFFNTESESVLYAWDKGWTVGYFLAKPMLSVVDNVNRRVVDLCPTCYETKRNK